MTPTAVVFDIGKVLLDFDYGIAARAMERHCNINAAGIRRALDQSPLLYEFETGHLTEEQFFTRARALINFRGDLELFRSMFGDIFTPIEAIVGMHTELAGRGVPTYIFSNTNEIAVAHIRRRFPFFASFTGYIFSYEARSMKPDAGIYEAVERVSGRRGAELLYIDDRPENHAAGLARGWQSIHHTDTATTLRAVAQSGLL